MDPPPYMAKQKQDDQHDMMIMTLDMYLLMTS